MPPKRVKKEEDEFDEEMEEEDFAEEESAEGYPSDVEDEDEEGGANEYVEDDFVVGDDDEEMEEEEEPVHDYKPKKKKKQKKKREKIEAASEDSNLDEDRELVEENKELDRRQMHRLKKGRELRTGDEMEEEEEADEFAEEEAEDFIEDNIHGSQRRIRERREERSSYLNDLYDQERTGDYSEKKVDLTQIYEPDEIKERFARVEDERMKILDMPERYQIRYKNRENPTSEELHAETLWIANRLLYEYNAEHRLNMSKEELSELVFKILNLIRVQNYEVMYIYHYEFLKEFPSKDFTLDHLWQIYDLDLEWNALYRKKNAINRMLETAENLNPIDPFIREHLESCQDLQTLQDLQEYVEYIMVKYKVDSKSTGGGQFKKPSKLNFVSEAMKYHLDELAARVAITPDELAHNLEADSRRSNHQVKYPDFYRDFPEDAIKKYIDENVTFLATSLKCLFSIVGLMARDLYYHPIIRKLLRKEFLDQNMQLETNPTEKGKKELDIYHPQFFVKRVRLAQPLKEMREDVWLAIVENEKKGRIEVKFKMGWGDDDTQDLIKQKLLKYYLAPFGSVGGADREVVQKWNIFRTEVIKMFLDEFMYKYLISWVRQELTTRAEKWVVRECGRRFKAKINMLPYKKEDKKGKVLAVMPDPGRGPVSFVMVDVNGEVIDRFVLNYLHNKQNPNQDKLLHEDFAKERKRLKQTLEKHKPLLIIVGACSIECFYLKSHLNDLAKDLIEEVKREKNVEFPSLWVDMADTSIAQLYAKSDLAAKEFKEDSLQIRAAISLGRYQQDPVAEVLQLWDEDPSKNLLLDLRLHQMQAHVDNSKIMNAYEKVAMEVINNVGFDINNAIKHPNLRSPLQFISGLGPRKAMYLIENIIDKCDMLNFRFQLCSTKILNKNVYDNCAGFLKVRVLNRNDSNYDVLDSTRIHPIHYDITRRICKLLVKKASDKDDVVQTIIDAPQSYLQNIERYKDEIEAMKLKWPWDLFISYIRDELTNPFKDPRESMSNLSKQDDELFYTLTKENPETFREGALVTAKVTKVHDQSSSAENKRGMVMCRLDCGIVGSIHQNDMPNPPVDLKEDMYIRARIKKILMKHLHVYLSLKDVNSHEHFFKDAFDSKDRSQRLRPSRHKFLNCEVKPEEDYPTTFEMSSNAAAARFRPRNIRHSMFKNISIQKAIDYLQNREVGSFLIRPSSKGLDHLSITWKFYENVFVHLDIKEEDKAPTAIISNKLRIGNELYQDLDEIIKMYIEPCNLLVKEIQKHKKFMKASLEKVEETLKEDRRTNPKVNSYYFVFVPQAPHFLLLCYLNAQMGLVTELIKVKPKGLFFHENFYQNLTDLITYMKQSFFTDSYQRYVRKAKAQFPLENLIAKPQPIDTSAQHRDTWGGNSTRVKMEIENDSQRRHGGGGGRGDRGEFLCHNCHKPGHKAKDCPEPRQGGPRGDRMKGEGDRRGGYDRGGDRGDRGPRKERSGGWEQGGRGGRDNDRDGGRSGGYSKGPRGGGNRDNGGSWGGKRGGDSWGDDKGGDGGWNESDNKKRGRSRSRSQEKRKGNVISNDTWGTNDDGGWGQSNQEGPSGGF